MEQPSVMAFEMRFFNISEHIVICLVFAYAFVRLVALLIVQKDFVSQSLFFSVGLLLSLALKRNVKEGGGRNKGLASLYNVRGQLPSIFLRAVQKCKRLIL
jgi:hypothetical protein